MKKLLFSTLILSLYILNSFAQDYSYYYNNCNIADSLTNKKEFSKALKHYDEAFSSVNYLHAENLRKSTYCAIKSGNYEKAYVYAKQSVLNGGEKYVLKWIKSRKFRRTHYYHNLKDSIEIFRNMHSEKTNNKYKEVIDSIYYIDQFIIRNDKSVKGNYKIDIANLPTDRYKLDNGNFTELLKLINQFGFPTEKTLGEISYGKASAILHHNLRKQENEKYHTMIIDAIVKGWYNPEDFSFWYEQFYMNCKGQTFFTTWDKNKTKSNIARLNKNRTKYYLKRI